MITQIAKNVQTIQGHKVNVIVRKGHGKFIMPVMSGDIIDYSHAIPVELASLAAGKDAWMRQILVRCSDCKEKHTIEALYQDCPGCCPACSEKALAEMENQ